MIFHRHDWNLIRTDCIPATNLSLYELKTRSTADTQAVMDAMRDKFVYIFKCECGKVRVVKK